MARLRDPVTLLAGDGREPVAGVSGNEQVVGLDGAGAASRIQLFLDGDIPVARSDRSRHCISFGRSRLGRATGGRGTEDDEPGGHVRVILDEEDVGRRKRGDIVEHDVEIGDAITIGVAEKVHAAGNDFLSELAGGAAESVAADRVEAIRIGCRRIDIKKAQVNLVGQRLEIGDMIDGAVGSIRN